MRKTQDDLPGFVYLLVSKPIPPFFVYPVRKHPKIEPVIETLASPQVAGMISMRGFVPTVEAAESNCGAKHLSMLENHFDYVLVDVVSSIKLGIAVENEDVQRLGQMKGPHPVLI